MDVAMTPVPTPLLVQTASLMYVEYYTHLYTQAEYSPNWLIRQSIAHSTSFNTDTFQLDTSLPRSRPLLRALLHTYVYNPFPRYVERLQLPAVKFNLSLKMSGGKYLKRVGRTRVARTLSLVGSLVTLHAVPIRIVALQSRHLLGHTMLVRS